MKFSAIIFDLDGTIINSEHIWQKATNQLITLKGGFLPLDQHNNLQTALCGLAMHKACALIKDALQLQESVESLMETKKSLAVALYHEGIQFIEGFESFHQKTNLLKLKTGIATNADDTTLSMVKSSLNLSRFFGNHIYSISNVNNICKPDPAIYLHAARQLSVDPKECMAIEDSAHGIRAAQAAGMFCIGIATSKDPYQTKEADIIIHSYDQIDLHTLLQ
ncbi:MAG: HAD family phosphatase [Candidatus Babeliales bacterium]